MLHESEIKQEFKIDKLQCATCLSFGRKLTALGKNVDIFRKIAPKTGYWANCHMESVKICWECSGALTKMENFQNQVGRATGLLEIGQAYLYGTLSSLTTVIFNDTHPNTIYVTQMIEPTHTDAKPETGDGDDMDMSDFIDNTTDNIELKTELDIETNVKTKVKNNKWATKRALLNKKPKFKILRDYKVFRKIRINLDELSRCLAKERDSEWFKSSEFKCDSCILVFKDQSTLANHEIKRHSQTIGPYICDICHTRTSSKTTLASHISSHYYTYLCRLCAFSSVRATRTSAHASAHRTALLCCKCGHTFGLCAFSSVRATRTSAHRTALLCCKCGHTFGSRKEFYKHHKEYHEKFVCDHCGVSFKMRYCIKDHIRYHHQKFKRKQHSPFECKICDKRFSRYNGLWLHNKVCHSESAQSAYCVECDKRYADVYRYRWHLSNSARHRPRAKQRIPCPGCDKVFTKKIYMKDHYDLVHLKKFKYRCEQCDKNFLRNADLVQHRKRVHEGVLPPRNKVCYVCGRGFTTNKILNNHVRTHTGERPFACARCPAAFAQRAALAQHARARHA